MYAIVDIETTGGYSRQHGITEIAVIVSDGTKVVDKWESLVNPLQDIPAYITTLTGIDQSMVEDAPTFQEIAYELHDLLSDKVFVAHNVNFDFGFINHAFEEMGLPFNVRKLCTVRLSRKIVKGAPSYSLGKLTKTLGIKHEHPHRAMGDAIPTTDLFHQLYDRAPQIIDAAVKANSHEGILPANLPRDVFVSLPERPGVYYFHDAKGKVIYIGKAKNIKKRVNSHFTGRKKTRQQQVFLKEVFDITHELTGTELIAYLLEDSEIKHYWPRLNRAQKGNPSKFGAYVYTDREGYSRLAVNKISNGYPVIASFHSLWEARSWIIRMVEEYKLDPAKCGIPALTAEDRSEVHEKNLERLLTEKEEESLSYVIQGKGRDIEEVSFIWVHEGNYRGFGFMPKEIGFERMEEVEDYLHPKKETPTVRSILNNYINQPDPEGLTLL